MDKEKRLAVLQEYVTFYKKKLSEFNGKKEWDRKDIQYKLFTSEIEEYLFYVKNYEDNNKEYCRLYAIYRYNKHDFYILKKVFEPLLTIYYLGDRPIINIKVGVE